MKTCFILSYDRPLFLWACLDALYRLTRSNVRFVLVDSASRDPVVRSVIRGFERRAMFEEVVLLEENNKDWASAFFEAWHPKVGEFFYFIESDAVVADDHSGTCWVDRFQTVMNANPRLAMLGSAIDRDDFVELASLEARIGRRLNPEEQQQIKLFSPERTMAPIGSKDIASPFNPPGRLLALRTEPLQSHLGTVMSWQDGDMHRILRENGWETAIFGGVVHRHLSLLNYFDYPEYSMEQRDAYVNL